MYLQGTMVPYSNIKFINLGFSAFCHSKMKKTKTVQRMLVLQCSQIMLFIPAAQYYTQIKLCRMAGRIHFFFQNYRNVNSWKCKIKPKFNLGCNRIRLREVNMTLNGNKINLPKSVTIKFRDKFNIRHVVKREPLLFHIMLKQGFTWFTLDPNNPQ